MGRTSAGIRLYRRRRGDLEVLLVHPGGPFWARKDLGAWSVPKGEHGAGEDPLAAAKREFEEELGARVEGAFFPLDPVVQRGGKAVRAFAVEGDLDTARVVSNTFAMEWPPKSGRTREFPEIDRAEWFSLAEARRRISSGQIPLLDDLAQRVEQAGDATRP